MEANINAYSQTSPFTVHSQGNVHFTFATGLYGGIVLCGQSYDISFLGADVAFVALIGVDGSLVWSKAVSMIGVTLRTIGCPVYNS